MAKHRRLPKKSQRDHSRSSQAAPDYEIGYGRPPVHSRFKPGKSGHLKGRTKGRRNVRTVVEEVLNQRIVIREGERTRSLSKLEGLVLTMVNKALQGDAKTQAALISLLRALGMTGEMPEPTRTEPVTDHDADVIADYLRRHAAPNENTADHRQSTSAGDRPKP